jgi:serine protease Do
MDPTTQSQSLSEGAQAAVAAVAPSVVRVGRGLGRGNGVVLAPGQVATNAHNLRGPGALLTFAGGRQVVGTVAAVDTDADLAVLSADTGDAPAVRWSTGDVVQGEVVFAVARSSSYGDRVSFGIVSQVAASFRGPRGRRIKGSLEHTAPLPRGSSGSPVARADGTVVGINTHRMGDGYYLAVPAGADLAQRLAHLAEGQTPERPRLGVALAPAKVAAALRRSVGLPERDGLLVREVEDGSPAARAGVQEGDLLVAVGDTPVAGLDDLLDALDAAGPTPTLTVVRGVEELTIPVELAPDQH